MEATDLAAVERTRAGDTAAFRVLVERYGRSVFRLAFRMTANEFDAEDVVQETFLRAFKQLDSYESRSSFSTWLYRIAANYSLDLIRSRKRHAARHVADTAEQEDVLDSVKTNDPGQDRVYYSSQVKQRLDAALATAQRSGADGVPVAALRRQVDRGDRRDSRSWASARRKTVSFERFEKSGRLWNR